MTCIIVMYDMYHSDVLEYDMYHHSDVLEYDMYHHSDVLEYDNIIIVMY